ncbi:LptA/OstA family protein [Desulfonema magnum]|nr:LptA/OstA family protein [Desulfonema magnum]
MSWIFLTIFFTYAGETAADPGNDKGKIRISAKTLVSDSEAKYAEFTGNVRAIQGNTVITSDRLRVFYKAVSGNKQKPVSGEQAIEKIVAEGNVKIKFDNKVAETEHAVYTTKDKVLVLSGPGSKLISGNNSISGSKITLYRAEGRIKFESNSDKPVEAVLYPGENGIK